MKIALITNCTSRKRTSGEIIHADLLQQFAPESLGTYVGLWQAHLSSVGTYRQAIDTYLGRSVQEVKKAATVVGGQVFFVSAGLGLLSGNTFIPSYNLTVSSGEGSIQTLLQQTRSTSADWWMHLTRNENSLAVGSLSHWLESTDIDVALIALPSNYLSMLRLDLGAIPSKSAPQIRIFSSPSSKKLLPDHLQPCLMPYDDRLETSGKPGTKGDFPQRAMHHFVNDLQGHLLTLADSHQAVQNLMAQLRPPISIQRPRLTDQEILCLLKANWEYNQGQSTRLLKFLRHEAGVACEQSRFRQLWLQAKQSLTSGN